MFAFNFDYGAASVPWHDHPCETSSAEQLAHLFSRRSLSAVSFLAPRAGEPISRDYRAGRTAHASSAKATFKAEPVS